MKRIFHTQGMGFDPEFSRSHHDSAGEPGSVRVVPVSPALVQASDVVLAAQGERVRATCGR